MDRLVIEKDGEDYQLNTKVVVDISKLRSLLSEDAWKIYSLLHEKPGYPAQIAKDLGLNEQNVYYYIKQLSAAGLLEVEKSEERNGGMAKFYSAPFDSFSIVANPGKAGRRILAQEKRNAHTPEFLLDFTRKGIFSAKIVVGSPDPHGPMKARARDGHLAAELAAFFGANCAGFELPLVFLDTMVEDLKEENSNLVIVGGPVTNKLAEQANRFMPIQFSSEKGLWTIVSKPSGKRYADDSIGVVEKIPHPYFRGKWVMLVAGKRNSGTISAILALAKRTSEAIRPNSSDPKVLARVVEGLDVDGDGLIDEVEFRE